MKYNIFTINQQIEITALNPLNGKMNIYKSRIEDIGDASITIASPYVQGSFLPPTINGRFKTSIIAENGIFSFDVKLVEVVEDPLPLWVVSVISDIDKMQRRSYVRLNINLPARYNYVIEDGNNNYSTSIYTNNISGGGVQLLSGSYMPVGAKLKLFLPLNGDVVETEGVVVHSIPPASLGRNYKIGVKFAKIEERKRDAIVKFIFQKQVELRKKGLVS